MNVVQRIVVSSDFSDAPGARYRSDGPKSGQEFLEDLLRPKFLLAEELQGLLHVDLDGTWGYASSFISGSFGALAKEFSARRTRHRLVFKSDEDSILLEKIEKEIETEGDHGKNN